ncbi:MAG TPA: twin-arginine translocation signal domain-containing protein, partial [Acidimicrobiales bacterium]|nr:twin-arginine translocation signal domain-containing protein [Acidimicrobiales bacterium]
MEISERELRRLVADSDEAHRAAMDTFTDDNRGLIFETRSSRRKFLAGLGLGSAAVVIGSAALPVGRMVPRAWSQTAPSDGDIATFAASVEYAAVAAYPAAAKSGKVKTKAGLDAA